MNNNISIEESRDLNIKECTRSSEAIIGQQCLNLNQHFYLPMQSLVICMSATKCFSTMS